MAREIEGERCERVSADFEYNAHALTTLTILTL